VNKKCLFKPVPLLSLPLLLVLHTPADSATIPCDSCEDCSSKIQSASPGDVILLSGDITADAGTSCIDFNGKGSIVLDGDGHTITNEGEVNYGIFSGFNGGQENTIKNCTVIGFTQGLYLVYGGSSTIRSCVFLRNSRGIDLYSSDSNIIQDVFFSQNSTGISIRYDSDNNLVRDSYLVGNYAGGISFSPHPDVGDPEFNSIYNNFFRNAQNNNVQLGRISTDRDRELENPNLFNTDLDCSSGGNLIGGGCMGGNYWGSLSGDGFSETCADADGDGISDAPFDFSGNGATMIDLHPLTEVSGVGCAIRDRDGDGFDGVSCGGSDCDDSPAACGGNCFPGGIEVCDGYDNDCNGKIDDGVFCADTLLIRPARYPSIISDLSCVEDSATNQIYCFGGVFRAGTDKPQTDLIVKYDPLTDTLTPLEARLPTIRDGLSCVESSATQKIYCLGGYWQEFECTQMEEWGCVAGTVYPHYIDDILEFDPGTGNITTRPVQLPPSAARTEFSCVEDSSTQTIYCFGGSDSSGRKDQIFSYDPATDTVTIQSATLPSPRSSLSCVQDSSTGKIYCFGGFSESGTDEILEYDPATDTLTIQEARLPAAVNRLSCREDSSSHKIYCFGGQERNSGYIKNIYEYDPAADTLVEMEAEFPWGRYGLSCVEDTSSHKFYCFGGSRNVVYFDEIVEYTARVQDTPPVLECPGDEIPLAPVDASCRAPLPDLAGEITVSDDFTAREDLIITQEPGPGTMMERGEHWIEFTAEDASGNRSECSLKVTVNELQADAVTISGPAEAEIGQEVLLEAELAGVDAGASPAYEWMIGDDVISRERTATVGPPYNETEGTVTVSLTAGDGICDEAASSRGITFSALKNWKPCDSDGNGALNVADVIQFLNYYFLGVYDPACRGALDCDGNGKLDVTDAITNLNYQFVNGIPPPSFPFECRRYTREVAEPGAEPCPVSDGCQ